MKNVQTWVIIGLVVLLVISILTRPTKEITDLTPYRTALAIADHQIDSLTKSNRATIKRIQEDSILQAEEKQAYQKSITGLQARLRNKRDRIDTLILESPALQEYVATADSVISFQSARIDSLEIDKAELRVDIRAITENFLKQIEQHESKLKATEQLADAYKRDSRKSKRANRWAKAGAVVLGVGGFLLGSQL